MHISRSWTGKSSDAYQYALFIDNLFTGNSSEVLRHQLRLRQVNVGVNSNGDFRFFGDIVPVRRVSEETGSPTRKRGNK